MKHYMPAALLVASAVFSGCDGGVPFTEKRESIDPALVERARRESSECAHIVRGDPQIIGPGEKTDPWTAKNNACNEAMIDFLQDHLDDKSALPSSSGEQSNNSFKPNPLRGSA